jgi:tRNA(His) 5'-end guanylyltransferase
MNKSLGDRMKEYEVRARSYVQRRGYTIVRIDGKAFHTYTRGLEKPFDEPLMEDFKETTKYLCENVQGCKLGYTQSDEISLVITDFDTHQTDAFFDGQVQKLCSIIASMTTFEFNCRRQDRNSWINNDGKNVCDVPKFSQKPALFDARVFSVPTLSEATNYLTWRQRDAVKNSISMFAQSMFSQTELHKKNGEDMQDMMKEKDFNWNDADPSKKRGTTVVKRKIDLTSDDGDLYTRNVWKFETPHFNSEVGEEYTKEVIPLNE